MPDRTCSVDDCTRPPRSRHVDLCRMHEYRLRYFGTLDLTGTCCICNCAIPYRGKGRRQTLCADERCRRAYQVQRVQKYAKQNPERVRRATSASRAKNPEKYAATLRRNHLRREYGITVAEYDALSEAQGGVCAICHGPQIKRQWLAVDHNHETGEVRGLLCDKCNMAVGLFDDNPQVLASAIAYLST